MGAGASTANPQDVNLLNDCLNEAKSRFRDDPNIIINDLQDSLLVELSSERLSALLPVLQVAIVKYTDERVNNISHTEACEAAVRAGRSVFSAGKTLRPVLSPSSPKGDFTSPNSFPPSPGPLPSPISQSQTIVATPTVATATSITTQPIVDEQTERIKNNNFDPMPTEEEKKKWRTPRVRGRGKVHRGPRNPVPQSKLFLSGLRSSYEEAEIGGGTMYTTEVSLYEDGTAELGNHDIGQRGRQVHRRQRRGDGFSDALFWGGYEYYDGTWKLIENGGDSMDNNVDGGSGEGGGGGENKTVSSRTFLLSLTKITTQPSDPYSSERAERDINVSFILTENKSIKSTTTINKSSNSNQILIQDENGDHVEVKTNENSDHVDKQNAAAEEGKEQEKNQVQKTNQNESSSLSLSNIQGELNVRFKDLRVGNEVPSTSTSD
mmetsp:Transcript_19248/g.22945  ORF Transcript_19248/g.22945 Transcript_19248/m.22945 type:complete len:436 (+) Transcript_19248:126-1433(+)|eukprot:CAMPEP_0114363782 /NCGR_PEP_ID=MMETSP0101-20121206/26884_1 /TAXON_ID=38822 ORGANISM="Pteridomonas danica, Strain PT" /NCGR_SAMPLE_ID=MMETSP0101 /ASSEMBLY_ACC=CAM_ASM_000211 /LENGTH=435 /DNA_ID=CAMNT_0001510715 /DNA_START=118 /DNA_END=1425 /DNA_ORIENTATION=-